MKMLKFVLILSLLPAFVCGQPEKSSDDRRLDEIKAQKIAYITAKLDLTPAEAQQFWPVYNEYSQKKEEIHRERFGKPDEPKPFDVEKMNDKEAGQILDNMGADQEHMASIEKEYSAKFRKLLPVKKVLKLYEAELEFRRVLLDRIRERRPDDRQEKRPERGRP